MRKTSFTLSALLLAAFMAAPAAAELPFTMYGQLGFGKIMEDGAPDGGLGFGGGIVYPLSNPAFAIGGEVGYMMLGKDSYGFDVGGYGVKAESSFR